MLFERAAEFGSRPALITPSATHGYDELLAASAGVAAGLLGGADDLAERPVPFLAAPGFEYAAMQWGIWRAGGIAVPLGLSHPPAELEYVLADTAADTVLATAECSKSLAPLASAGARRLLAVEDLIGRSPVVLPQLDPARRAMILYTSGTTSRPKGVVTTHAQIAAQIRSLVEAWRWTRDDHILHVLPLHHIHGIINVLACALWSGARCEFLAPFDAERVLERFAEGGLSLFMAVPTMYARLIAAWERCSDECRRAVSAGCRDMRLMVSGSAALPAATLARWQAVSGHALLERYGMTEIGMALSNPLAGERVPGHVGGLLPGVELRRVDDAGRVLELDDVPGEIEVRGPGVFLEYWGRPEETQAAFRDGWFRTGDVAVVDDGGYRLLGRTSVDIIKTGGYKVSALEIEEVLRTHPEIDECAVVGLPNDEWGERVAACVVGRNGARLQLAALRDWAKQRLAVYKVPTRLKLVPELPRNAMGKVQKPAVKSLFAADESSPCESS